MQLDFLHHTSLWDKSRFHLTQTKRRKKSKKHAHSFDDERNLIRKRCKYTRTQRRTALSTYIERWKHVIEECTGRNSAATRQLQKKCRGRTDDRGKEEAPYVRPCVRVFPLKLQRLFWICCGCNRPWHGPLVAPISLPKDPSFLLCLGPPLGP
jgi:hypothetical protein